MTPHEFILKWRAGGDERRDAQPFFEDLCRLLGHQTPREADPGHTWFTYEQGATKTSGGEGWADVWKKGFFGWEAKGTHKSLDKAYQQLKMYADALQNPPLLVVSDLQKIVVHTNFTNSVKTEYVIHVEELEDHRKRDILRAVFFDPEQLKPGTTRKAITEDAAKKFATLAEKLRARGHKPSDVAQFLNRLLFCMFAEETNIGLLPDELFSDLVTASQDDPDFFDKNVRELFRAMQSGGHLAFKKIAWFNGGLFKDDITLPLLKEDLVVLKDACELDWADIDPSIFGTLFERGLDPEKRGQLGAHYTDPDTIMRIVGPVVVEPWKAKWDRQKTLIGDLMKKADVFGPTAKTSSEKALRTKAEKEAQNLLKAFLDELRNFVVLDPACGSGNFLYLALRALKNIEHTAIVEAESLGLGRQFPGVGPANVKGIEINEYAAELARITIWIGEIQWMIQKGYGANQNPILRPLDQIENRDALLDVAMNAANWPQANVIVGNPPFLGARKMKPELGSDYVDALRIKYRGLVHKGSDFVCYWVGKSWDLMQAGRIERVGLVATNSITGGASRKVLEPIARANSFSSVWPNEPWVVEGAAVRVCIAVFEPAPLQHKVNDAVVERITADLQGTSAHNSFSPETARKLKRNHGVSFQGVVLRSNVKKKEAERLKLKDASFSVPGPAARVMLGVTGNPNGRPNSDVLAPLINGDDITGRPSDRFIVDFQGLDEMQASMYEAPFEHIMPVKDHRAAMGQPEALETWWLPWRARADMRAALKSLNRYIATPAVSKHRIWTWQSSRVLPDHAVIVVAKDDDTTMGILHSRIHDVWALRMGTSLEDRPRYTPTTCFETFPFPDGLTPDASANKHATDPRSMNIAQAAHDLVIARDNWLNPPAMVDTVPEVVPGYPARLVAKAGNETKVKALTLTNLYNARPPWLSKLHDVLDAAVAAAYGWPWPLTDEEILHRLLELNMSRADAGE